MHHHQTKVLFLGHASVLISFNGQFLLTDPWFVRPAFGSWLPVPPFVINPAYLLALKERLRIVISHGHDDHCDDELLSLFAAECPIHIANFDSPGVKRRLEKIGCKNIHVVSSEGVQSGPFMIKSYIDREISLDDAIFSIGTEDAFVVHAQDNWREPAAPILQSLRTDSLRVGKKKSLYMSQTNSASGYPLNYHELSEQEKRAILFKKVSDMATTGMRNAAAIGSEHFLSYAGYSGVFVKDHPEYFNQNFFPSSRFLLDSMKADIPPGLEILDMLPGDMFDFDVVHKSLFSPFIQDDDLKSASKAFYDKYGLIDRCSSFHRSEATVDIDLFSSNLSYFLEQFNSFVVQKVASSGFLPTIVGKTLQIEVPDLNLITAVKFGEGLTESTDYNKKIKVQSVVMDEIVRGESLFENLCTGYAGEFSRRPRDVYNRDIVLYMVMYSYVYRERLAKSRPSANAASAAASGSRNG
jgi:beta-lactamase family protein